MQCESSKLQPAKMLLCHLCNFFFGCCLYTTGACLYIFFCVWLRRTANAKRLIPNTLSLGIKFWAHQDLVTGRHDTTKMSLH